MNKKQLIVVWNLSTIALLFCFFVSTAFAAVRVNSFRRRNIRHRSIPTSGGQFAKLSANFNRLSFSTRSNTGKLSRNSFGIASNKGVFPRPSGDFSRPSFSIKPKKGEFSKPSFTIANNKGEFSKPSFSISSGSILSNTKRR